jgi:hypothetical protein
MNGLADDGKISLFAAVKRSAEKVDGCQDCRDPAWHE